MECKHQIVGRTKNGFLFLHPCGQCLQCRINDTRAWYVRSHFELKKLDRPFHYFLTLTYNDENIPEDGLCKKDHLKKFLNNLNTSYGLHLRYYACADYGSINNRCHYHAILLSENKITHKMVDNIWKKGFSCLKECNTNNIKYTLRYTVKKKPFDSKDPAYFRLVSKGWGDNVAQYWHEGQEKFTIDGRDYGISRYLREKLGLDGKKVPIYVNNRDLILSPNYQKVDTDEKYIQGIIDLNVARRKLK